MKNFRRDLIALIPLHPMLRFIVPDKYLRLVYLAKLTRLLDAFEQLSKANLIKATKKFFHVKMLDIIANNEERAADVTVDSTYISLIVAISYSVRTVFLIAFIVCGSFFIGLLWLVYCDIANAEESDNFITTNDVFAKGSTVDQAIMLTYFSFTTLSTVGFGDYHPITDSERLASAFVLLFGVAMTSFIMENLNGMISNLYSLQADFEKHNELSLFFGTLERFNNGNKV